MRYTFEQFKQEYPDDDACLESVFRNRFGDLNICPKCGVTDAKFYRVKKRQCYACKDCGHQLYPLAETIFRKTTTPLWSWFYAIYLFSVSKNGVSAKELERHLGVTYKTAWRMCKQIRILMQQDSEQLEGEVEVDEAYIGGARKAYKGNKYVNKSVVFGMVERNGSAKILHVHSNGARVLLQEIDRHVKTGTQIHSDEYGGYRTLRRRGYSHTTVNHSKLEYARGSTHTNTVEGFWSQLKRSIEGTYHSVSPKYLQLYLNEFAFRYNFRDVPICPILLELAGKRA